MKKLLALLAAVGAVVFFWRRKHADDDAWDTASDTASSWGETASDKGWRLPATRRRTPPTPATPCRWRRRRSRRGGGHHLLSAPACRRRHTGGPPCGGRRPPGNWPPSGTTSRPKSGPRGVRSAATPWARSSSVSSRRPRGMDLAGDRAFAAAACGDDVAVVTGRRRPTTPRASSPCAKARCSSAPCARLAALPDVLLVDASGRDHPRRCGLALHLGAVLGVPTVGVTHRPLRAEGEWPDDERGATSALVLDGERVGYWVRTKRGHATARSARRLAHGSGDRRRGAAHRDRESPHSRATAPCSLRRSQAARTAGAPHGVKRLRGEHVAVAAGLLLAAVAAVTLLTRGDDEQPPTTTHAAPPLPPPPPPSALPRHRAAVRGGRLVVDGKPFFPIMSWGECTDGFETSLPVGTNLYAGNRCGGPRCAAARARGPRALGRGPG